MAFPDDVTTLMRAVNPTTAIDAQNIKEYQELLMQGNFSDAQTLLQNMTNGVQMNLNAGRYNEVLDLIEQIEQFYLGLNGVRNYIYNNVDKYLDVAEYVENIDYSIGNLAHKNNKWFKCIMANGPASTVIIPETTENWANYWEYFLLNQVAYPVQEEEPVGLNEGDIWFKVMN